MSEIQFAGFPAVSDRVEPLLSCDFSSNNASANPVEAEMRNLGASMPTCGNSQTAPSAEKEALQKIERSIVYMQEHVNEPLRVSTLAALINVSQSHFFALFKQRTGSPPMDYFTQLRMRHAGKLLDSTSASVKQVAAALGYDDPFYFSRVFKSVHKVPPSRYRPVRQPI